MRKDLLALTDEDLIAWTNRGTLKRAYKDLDKLAIILRVEDDSSVHAEFPDGIQCSLPADKAANDGTCSCVVFGICRHLVTCVLAYQQASPQEEEALPEPWDPGHIDNTVLSETFDKRDMNYAYKQLEAGILVELVRAVKPLARFREMAVTVRFLVPDDPRYTWCDCAAANPCRHVPLAVMAFRKLASDKEAGLISTFAKPDLPDLGLIERVHNITMNIAVDGIQGLPPTWKGRAERLVEDLANAGLVWPSQIMSELVCQIDWYKQKDGRFSPTICIDLLGELLIRQDTIEAERDEPFQLVRGGSQDQFTELGSARLIGLGGVTEVIPGGIRTSAFLQDSDSGTMAVLTRDNTDPDDDRKHSFARLGERTLSRDISATAAARGQLLMQSARRAPDGCLTLGRRRMVVNPQSFKWDKLHPPTLVDNFNELRARLQDQPPASLRSRRLTEDVHVCPLAVIDSMHFDHREQRLAALLIDADEGSAVLSLPYHSRGRGGLERLMEVASHRKPRYVSGKFRLTAQGLEVQPYAVVFEGETAPIVVLPFFDDYEEEQGSPLSLEATGGRIDPITAFLADLLTALGELLKLGQDEIDAYAVKAWKDLGERGERLGSTLLAENIQHFIQILEATSGQVRRDLEQTGKQLLNLAKMVRLATDIQG